jgi:hypothetical protein
MNYFVVTELTFLSIGFGLLLFVVYGSLFTLSVNDLQDVLVEMNTNRPLPVQHCGCQAVRSAIAVKPGFCHQCHS